MRNPADRGATAVEFGLLVGILGVGIVSAASVAGGALHGVLSAAISAIAG